MSSGALLLVLQFIHSSPDIGAQIASVALPANLLVEVLGAVLATFALARLREMQSRERLLAETVRQSRRSDLSGDLISPLFDQSLGEYACLRHTTVNNKILRFS